MHCLDFLEKRILLSQSPYNPTQTPWPMPLQIQAEDFDTGGQGVAYFDTTSPNEGFAFRVSESIDIQTTTDTGGGYNVGWVKKNEWLEYTIEVAEAGTYDLQIRVANKSTGGKFRIEFNGVDKTGVMSIPNTGGTQSFMTLTKRVSLVAGVQVMRIMMLNEGGSGYVGNFNWIQIVPPASTVPAAPSGLVATATTRVDLNWQNHSSNQVGFKIERKTEGASGFVQIAVVSAGVTSFSDQAVAPATQYVYRVKAYNGAGDSGYSNEFIITTGVEVAPFSAWETGVAAPMARYEAQGAVVDGKLYMFGGFFNSALEATTRSDVFDPIANTWTQLSNAPQPLTHAALAVDGAKIWVVGGFVGTHPGPDTAEVWTYDTLTDSWSAGPSLPESRAAGAAAVVGRMLHFYGGGQHDDHEIIDKGDHWVLDLDNPGLGWQVAAALPNPRNHLSGVAVDGLIYAIGGQHGHDEMSGNQSSVHAYDPATNQWQEAASLPKGRGHAAALVLDGRIVVIGGTENGNKAMADVTAYDPSTNTWREWPALPAIRKTPVAGLIDNRLIVTTGNPGSATATNTTWIATLQGAWQSAALMPVALGEVANGVIDGRLYVVGDGSDNTLVYDLGTGDWTDTLAVRPYPAKDQLAQVVNGKLYVFGGVVGSGSSKVALDKTQIYDPATDAWSLGADMPFPSFAAQTALIAGEVYLAGGITTGLVTTDQVAKYDPSTNTWTMLANMPQKRNSAATGTDGQQMYLFGGRDGGDVVENGFNTVQVYDPQTDAWISSLDPGSTLIPLPQGRGGIVRAPYYAGEFYVIGGETKTGPGATAQNVYDRVDIYNPVTNTWRQGPEMPTARHGISPIFHEGRIYVAGGGIMSGNSQSGILEIFHLTAGSGLSQATEINFDKSVLTGTSLSHPTSLQFGPDGRLYVGQQDGLIKIYTVNQTGPSSYNVTASETVSSIQAISNHNDNGALNPSVTTRLLTGLVVTGTATNPVVFVSSSDPRVDDANLDTNSGIISRLTWNGSGWEKLDLVRGLPRSLHNHATNGLQYDANQNVLYVAQAGHTNMGAPSSSFEYLPEYALSAAILSIDLNAIGNSTYELPTLDDEDRISPNDMNDPFGGNKGKNQAMLVQGSPVQLFATGFRNPYDLVLGAGGRLYVIDNGPNAGWGGTPIGVGGDATNEPSEPGNSHPDNLHLVTQGSYAGHPNPTRANMANTFNPTNPQSPVFASNPVEGTYLTPGVNDGSLATFPFSTNGMVQYTSSAFGGAMLGDLLAVSFFGGNSVQRVKLNGTGTAVAHQDILLEGVDNAPLDITVLGDGGLFPGTIWIADWATGKITVYEPNANGTPPEEPPPSTDDDGDGISNLLDPFGVDAANGQANYLPVFYPWSSDSVSPGGLLNTGFTGLMTNGTTDYKDLWNPADVIAGGAAGIFTIAEVGAGTALGNQNDQEFAFQFGVNVGLIAVPFIAYTRVLNPFAGLTPQVGQSMGLYIGTGDQDNFVQIGVSGAGGVQWVKEVGGVNTFGELAALSLSGLQYVDLSLLVDPQALTVQPSFSFTVEGVTSELFQFTPVSIPAGWLSGATAMATGVIATNGGTTSFPASYGFIGVQATQNLAPVVNAGADMTLDLGTPATLVGSIHDDGLPENTELITHWSVVSGPGQVTFDNVNSPVTAVNFIAAGTYVLRLTADDGALSSSDDLTVVVNQPIVQAPYHGTPFLVGQTIQAEDFDLGGAGVAYFDTTAGNERDVYRTDESVDIQPTTDAGGGYNVGWVNKDEWLEYTIDVAVPGTYDLQIRVANKSSGGKFRIEFNSVDKTGVMITPNTGGTQSFVTLTKSVSLDAGVQVMRIVMLSEAGSGYVGNFNWIRISDGSSTNQAPVVNAGTDVSVTLPGSLALVGAASDDGLPTGSLVSTWSMFSGTGTVTFADASSPATSVSFSAAGTYVLRLTASDSVLSAFDDITVIVNPDPSPIVQTPFHGTPFLVGQTIQAEDFDSGGAGVAYFDTTALNEGGAYRPSEMVDIQPTTDAGAGYNVGWAKTDEWLEYTIDVTEAGTYELQIRVANKAGGGRFRIEFDGIDKTGVVDVPQTGGSQNWVTLTKNVSLDAGVQVMRIVMLRHQGSNYVGNFNWFQIVSTPVTTSAMSLSSPSATWSTTTISAVSPVEDKDDSSEIRSIWLELVDVFAG